MRVVVDTSAVMAVLRSEPGHELVTAAMSAADDRVMSAGTAVELGVVLAARTKGALGIAGVLARLDVTIVPVDAAQVAEAVMAFETFGKGRAPAALNYGDCFAYALARVLDAPLVCVGQDFSRTDLAVLPSPSKARSTP